VGQEAWAKAEKIVTPLLPVLSVYLRTKIGGTL
jgi:hypothetical protein